MSFLCLPKGFARRAVDITALSRAIAEDRIPYQVVEIEPTDEGVTIDTTYVEAMSESALDEPGIVRAGMLNARLMDGRHRGAKAIKLGRKTIRTVVVTAPDYLPFIVADHG